MSQSKHTEGTWLAIYDEDHDCYHIIKKKEINDAFSGTVVIACEIEQGSDSGKADAKLIAAAPEMLSVLKTVEEYTTQCDLPPRMKEAMSEVIKKATK